MYERELYLHKRPIMSYQVDPDCRLTTVSHNLNVFHTLLCASHRASEIASWLSNNIGGFASSGPSSLTQSNWFNLSNLLNASNASFLFQPGEIAQLSNFASLLDTSDMLGLSNLLGYLKANNSANFYKLTYLLSSPAASFLFDPSTLISYGSEFL